MALATFRSFAMLRSRCSRDCGAMPYYAVQKDSPRQKGAIAAELGIAYSSFWMSRDLNEKFEPVDIRRQPEHHICANGEVE